MLETKKYVSGLRILRSYMDKQETLGKDVRKIQINTDDLDLNNRLDNFMQMERTS